MSRVDPMREPRFQCGPEYLPSVDLMDCMLGWSLNWSEWRDTYGAGLRSWLRFMWSFGTVPASVGKRALHNSMAIRSQCHFYDGHQHHYCHRGELVDFEHRLLQRSH